MTRLMSAAASWTASSPNKTTTSTTTRPPRLSCPTWPATDLPASGLRRKLRRLHQHRPGRPRPTSLPGLHTRRARVRLPADSARRPLLVTTSRKGVPYPRSVVRHLFCGYGWYPRRQLLGKGFPKTKPSHKIEGLGRRCRRRSARIRCRGRPRTCNDVPSGCGNEHEKPRVAAGGPRSRPPCIWLYLVHR